MPDFAFWLLFSFLASIFIFHVLNICLPYIDFHIFLTSICLCSEAIFLRYYVSDIWFWKYYFSEKTWIIFTDCRSSPPDLFFGKGVPKICGKFTGEYQNLSREKELFCWTRRYTDKISCSVKNMSLWQDIELFWILIEGTNSEYPREIWYWWRFTYFSWDTKMFLCGNSLLSGKIWRTFLSLMDWQTSI